MLYLLVCSRSQRLVGAVAARVDVMERQHNHLNLASMDIIEKVAREEVDFGLKYNVKPFLERVRPLYFG